MHQEELTVVMVCLSFNPRHIVARLHHLKRRLSVSRMRVPDFTQTMPRNTLPQYTSRGSVLLHCVLYRGYTDSPSLPTVLPPSPQTLITLNVLVGVCTLYSTCVRRLTSKAMHLGPHSIPYERWGEEEVPLIPIQSNTVQS